LDSFKDELEILKNTQSIQDFKETISLVCKRSFYLFHLFSRSSYVLDECMTYFEIEHGLVEVCQTNF
jgi:hypothetical protein